METNSLSVTSGLPSARKALQQGSAGSGLPPAVEIANSWGDAQRLAPCGPCQAPVKVDCFGLVSGMCSLSSVPLVLYHICHGIFAMDPVLNLFVES